jgi:hypothetical protein
MSEITQNWRCWYSSLVVVSVLIASLQDSVFAQITPDSTLPNNSSVTKNGNSFNITGGTQAGSNLFHSFSEFSVPRGGAASFNNGVDIQNIISRVTGIPDRLEHFAFCQYTYMHKHILFKNDNQRFRRGEPSIARLSPF